MMTEGEYKAILAKYLPPSAVSPVFEYIKSNAVHFRITRQRSSKLGDYRMPQPRHNHHEISINGDLTPHLFLLVLLHEIAHLEVFKKYGRSVQPHGHEWQEEYRSLMLQYLNEGHFPEETRPLFVRYTAKIPLNRAAGQKLEQRLKELDMPDGTAHETRLNELPIGTNFALKNIPNIPFRSVEKRRTRYKCINLLSKQYFLVSGNAVVVCR